MGGAQVGQGATSTVCLGYHVVGLVGAVVSAQPADPGGGEGGDAVAFVLGGIAALP